LNGLSYMPILGKVPPPDNEPDAHAPDHQVFSPGSAIVGSFAVQRQGGQYLRIYIERANTLRSPSLGHGNGFLTRVPSADPTDWFRRECGSGRGADMACGRAHPLIGRLAGGRRSSRPVRSSQTILPPLGVADR